MFVCSFNVSSSRKFVICYRYLTHKMHKDTYSSAFFKNVEVNIGVSGKPCASFRFENMAKCDKIN